MRIPLPVLALAMSGWVFAAAGCPAPGAPPAESYLSRQPAQTRTLSPYSIAHTVANYYDAPLGLGILELAGNANTDYYDWMFKINLPLWQDPDGARPLGWLARGRLYTGTSVSALTGAGMVETGYEHTSFIVWETAQEWFRIKLTDGLYAWTNRCHLDAANIALGYVPWQTVLRRHGDWLHFRKPVAHILRALPAISSARVTMIGLEHKLVLLDLRGDWMEVEVRQPDITCGGQGGVQPSRHRGWVKWRGGAGPWVYFYTRGC